jgi:5'-methylthioadenosine phosphorylase
MGRLALVGGTGLLGVDVPEGEPRTVESERGPVTVLDAGSHVLLQRHHGHTYRPPHLIDHAANVGALRDAGCDRVLALASVGSLRRKLGVGTFVCPDDFIALHLGLSSFEDERGHLVPGFSPDWRARVVAAWQQAAGPLRDGGVYWQAIGPRLETPAEVRLMAAHADVVGMTIASESLVAREAGIDYAAICLVDNMANGIEGEAEATGPLSMDQVKAGVAANRPALLAALESVVPELAA